MFFSSLIAFGIIGLLWYLGIISPNWTYLALIPIILIYAMLPDIDSSSSMIHRAITALLAFVIIAVLIVVFAVIYYKLLVLYAFIAVGIGLVAGILLFVIQGLQHRGKVHSILLGFIFSLPLLFLGWVFFAGAFLAYISHLVLDAF